MLSRMHYYSRIQRESNGSAARVFESLYPDARLRRAVAIFFARIIRKAAAGTSAWSITLDPESIRFNVGPVQALSLWPDKLWLCLVGEAHEAGVHGLTDVSKGPVVYPKSVNVPSRAYELAAEKIATLPKPIRDQAYAYIAEAAARRTGRSAWLRSHSPGVLRFLEEYLRISLPRPAKPSNESAFAMPDEIDGQPASFVEGSVQRVFVNAYERNRAAREACIAHYGARCVICGFDFGAAYGAFAEGFIHVHHTTPLATIGRTYEVDPVSDLRPVCPNCHAAIHIGNGNRALEQLQRTVQARLNSPRLAPATEEPPFVNRHP